MTTKNQQCYIPGHSRQCCAYEQSPGGLSDSHADATSSPTCCPPTSSLHLENFVFGSRSTEGSAPSTAFDQWRSKVIVWATRKCLTDIFDYHKHLAPAEGYGLSGVEWREGRTALNSHSPLQNMRPMVAYFAAVNTSLWSAPDGRLTSGLPITFNI